MSGPCLIKHAKSYPFDIPEGSYVLGKDGWRELPPGGHETEGRHAVIASGSNAAPQRLGDKFQDHGHLLDEPLYVTRATLHDFDAVYSAHFSRYGSIPSTLAHAPGASVENFMTWLTDGQLDRMHETEAIGVNYDYVHLHGINLAVHGDGRLDNAHAYLSRKGCLNKDGAPVPLAELRTQGRKWAPMRQEEVLDYARSLIEPHKATDDFIMDGIESPALRKKRTGTLSKTALPMGWDSLIYLS